MSRTQWLNEKIEMKSLEALPTKLMVKVSKRKENFINLFNFSGRACKLARSYFHVSEFSSASNVLCILSPTFT